MLSIKRILAFTHSFNPKPCFAGYSRFFAALLCTLFANSVLAFELTPCLDESANEIYGAECATIKIPALHDGNEPSLEISITRVPSIRDTDKAPVIFIAGGPGQASTDLMPQFRHAFSSLLINHDFIFVDQRGTGSSHPLNCDIDYQSLSNMTAQEQVSKVINTHKKCVDAFTDDLTHFSTPLAVKDLEFVKNGLGYSKVALWGGSYGTRVALEYMRQFPESLAAVVIDGVAPTSLTLPFYTEEDANNALVIVLNQCNAQPTCQKAFPFLEDRWRQTLNNLKENPTKLIYNHPRTEEPVQVTIDDQILSSWVRTILYSRDFAQLLPKAMHRANNNNFKLLFTISSIATENMSIGISEGLQSTIICMEDASPALRNPPKTEQLGLLNLGDTESIKALCELYPKGNIPAEYYNAPQSDVPTLLLSGKLDPVTPPRWAEQVEKGLRNSRHLVIDGGHHFVSLLGCTPDIITQFIDNPDTLAQINSDCTNTIRPVPFFIDNAGPDLNHTAKSEGEE